MNPHLRYWLAALHLPGIGPRTVARWLEHFPTIQSVFEASQEVLLAAGMPPQHITLLKEPNWKAVEKDLAWAETSHHHLICRDDPDYPPLLREIHDPPLVLYVQGNKAALHLPQIAVVGSRHATPAGLKNAEQFSQYLAQTGMAITSGLALGIDAASHRGALSAKGITIGVVGTGLNHIYPYSNRKLYADILSQEGAVVSEFPLTMKAQAANFPRRNRIISGLSLGVLVVEAAIKSGSLITARHALEQGREVFAMPGSIHNPQARGCHHLIRQGAKLVETAADILEEMSALRATSSYTHAPLSQVIAEDIAPECRQLLEQLGFETTPVDEIILRSGLTAGEVSSILLSLELQGYVQSVPGGYARVATNH